MPIDIDTLDAEAIKKLRPITVGHDNSMLYDGLRSCMQRNAELQQTLLDSAQMIERLTKELNASQTLANNTRCC